VCTRGEGWGVANLSPGKGSEGMCDGVLCRVCVMYWQQRMCCGAAPAAPTAPAVTTVVVTSATILPLPQLLRQQKPKGE
jgi:hypothetical protein